jgi:S-adenosylmethionine/arginine decarboxylase-like enzyme
MKHGSIVLCVSLVASGCADFGTRKAPPMLKASKGPVALTPPVSQDLGAPAPSLAPESEVIKSKIGATDASKGCTWVENQAVVTAGDQDTKNQVRAAAISQAESNAMRDFLGMTVKSRTLDFQQESLRDQQALTESLLQTTRMGRILDENIIGEGYRDAPGCPGCRYAVTLNTCIVPIADDADKQFQAKLDISRTNFVDGDVAKLSVTVSRDCYVYLYDVDPDKNTSLIVPNEVLTEVKLKAGQTWDYPDEEAHKRGVTLVAQLPAGKDVSAETIRLVATKTPLPMKEQDPAMGGYLSLLRRLNHSHLEWTEDAQAFTIRRH